MSKPKFECVICFCRVNKETQAKLSRIHPTVDTDGAGGRIGVGARAGVSAGADAGAIVFFPRPAPGASSKRFKMAPRAKKASKINFWGSLLGGMLGPKIVQKTFPRAIQKVIIF